ncbi:hypothetical protein Q4Q34_03205 [Flavivirga abyssicola]|uniref:hypothetical protein n=1 Tax=Flavivirga abyssicola TaxID=3063533 RepID=UPI0026E01A6F|nr:hypothetical protein [Flavivirga sp. MEBiC07777]WVK14040.1 hypothetical protein Q4Q34_03205 [Flavivirga sp. MEBiC07777]
MKNTISKSNNKNYKSQNPETMETHINSQKLENMKNVIDLKQNTQETVMKQLDYIKIKVSNVKTFNREHLVDHPTIKNRFKMKFPENDYFGKTLHGNNIDIYYKNDTLYIDTSLPYLELGHNYTSFSGEQANQVLLYLSELLDVDITEGEVMAFEFGHIYHPKLNFSVLKDWLLSNIDLDILKNEKNFISFKHEKSQIKFYRVLPNLKRKVDKSIFNNLNPLGENPVKFEIKIAQKLGLKVSELTEYGMNIIGDAVINSLISDGIKANTYKYKGNKFDDILYMALLSSHSGNTKLMNRTINRLIDGSDLSYSQKTARRKSLKQKLQQLEEIRTVSFKQILTNEIHCDVAV